MPAAVYKVRFQQPARTRKRKQKTQGRPKSPNSKFFFNPSQVKTGVVLRSYGVLSQGLTWVVEKIITHKRVGVGEYRPKVVQEVEKLRDDVYMRCRETGERRTMQFQGLRYGAHWWLA